MKRLRVGVLGAGYWGPNVIRTFASLPDCEVAYVCDQRPGRLQFVGERFPGLKLTSRYEDLLEDSALDAVAVVTPVSTHRALASAALTAGKHVFVEKPLAATVADAAALVEAAAAANRVLATGHLFVYHPAVAYMRDVVALGDLGELCYAEAARVNLGPPSSEVSVIWDLAVHDVAILLSLVGQAPTEVAVAGRHCVHPTLTDVAFLRLSFANNFFAQLHVSWLSPLRVRRFFIAGSAGSATFDDTRDTGKLTVVGRGEDSRMGASDADARDLYYRTGAVRTPDLSNVLPLTAECAHFLECVRFGRVPLADGNAGLRVVQVLEAAEQSVASGGRPVAISTA